jgi:hypothetical protein
MYMNRLDIPICEWSIQGSKVGLLDMSITILNAALRRYNDAFLNRYLLIHHDYGTRTDRSTVLNDETRVIAVSPTENAYVSSK